MAYTPINWQTGDTITAEKMNKMDNGWGVQTTEISETVVTSAPPIPGAMAEGSFEYSTPITSSTLTVSLNGTTYTLPGTTYDSERMYGEYDSEEGEFIFTTYPLGIISTDSSNCLFTETSGTYLVGLSVQSLTVSDDFTSAVQNAGEETFAKKDVYPYIIELGTTTFADVWNAIENNRPVYFKNYVTSTNTFEYSAVVSASFNDFSVKLARIVEGSLVVATYSAESADDVLS